MVAQTCALAGEVSRSKVFDVVPGRPGVRRRLTSRPRRVESAGPAVCEVLLFPFCLVRTHYYLVFSYYCGRSHRRNEIPLYPALERGREGRGRCSEPLYLHRNSGLPCNPGSGKKAPRTWGRLSACAGSGVAIVRSLYGATGESPSWRRSR